MEKEFRAELVSSNEGLNSPDSLLSKVLESKGYNIKNAYALHWTPEQLEDIYVVLIDGSFLVSIEIDKMDTSKKPIFEEIDLKEYKKSLSKMNQVRLAVAQDLVNGKT